MKHGLATIVFGVMLGCMYSADVLAQPIKRVKPSRPIVCHHHPGDHPERIVRQQTKANRIDQNLARTKTAVFEVEYVNFPADNLAKTAFQHAIDIWESEIVSPVPIRIRAEWAGLTAGVIGQAIWGEAFANFGGEQHVNIFYPVALAEKIARRELNPSSEPDIYATFNSNISWYFGTDAKPPTGKMDMVTIALHEIAHGLGYTDTYGVNGSQGSVGLATASDAVPFIFDVFVENESGKNLIQDFTSPSNQLGTALQSSGLYFNSTLSVKSLSGVRPELYAPNAFDEGSSVSHLDETVFSGQGDPNKLMTPQIGFAEAIHDPGNVLRSMLSDMGWISVYIDHVPLKDTEVKNGQPYVVRAKVSGDQGFDEATLMMNYTTDGLSYTAVKMSPSSSPGEFEAQLPGTTTDIAYAYFLTVKDIDNRKFSNPGLVEQSGNKPQQGTHFFRVGSDVTKPVIVHDPVTFIESDETFVKVDAVVTDNMEVKEVLVEFFINDGAVQTKPLQPGSDADEFTVSIDLPPLKIGDRIRYRLIARDKAGVENIAIEPQNEFHTISVIGILPVQNSYANDFNSATQDFFGNNFEIATPKSFSNGAIHSDHPYKNGSGENFQSNYTYQLQIPIKIGNQNPVISFEEIVLVEPGENGSTFGNPDFFDYVIVEGSSDGGETWKNFAPGYDSRDQKNWLTRYNSNISNDDSKAVGDPSLYKERTINMLSSGNFAVGDEVLIRFRMFADQFANGWGWSIDNLKIQTPVTGVEQPMESGLMLYPNPTSQDLFIELKRGGAARISICDAHGRILLDDSISFPETGRRVKQINIQHLAPGMYLLKAVVDGDVAVRRFIRMDE